jgi:hypothetical protein
MGLGIRDQEKNLFRIPDTDPQYCFVLYGKKRRKRKTWEPLKGTFRARIYKSFRSPGIDSKESILPAYVWRAGTTNWVIILRTNLYTLKEPRNHFQGIDSVSLCSLAGRNVKQCCGTGAGTGTVGTATF